MKYLLNLVVTALLSTGFWTINAQESAAPSFPIDEKSGKVVYEEVVQVADVSQAELYDRAHNWFMTFFTNPGQVIQSADAEAGKIVGKHRLAIFKTHKGITGKAGNMLYTITLFTKEGRYKYKINDIVKLQTPKLPIEDWLEMDPRKPEIDDFLSQISTFYDELIADLNAKMKAGPEDNNEDDW